MPDILLTSLSGLFVSQKALAVTSHNIANANTPGYTRQRVEVGARRPQGSGIAAIGLGAEVKGVQRVFDQFLSAEVRSAEGAFSRLSTFHALANRIDAVIADPSAGLSPGLQDFFSAMQDIANDPSSIPSREVLLGNAEALAGRFHTLNGQLEDLGTEVGSRIGQVVGQINTIATQIGKINSQVLSTSAASGQSPNDLLDQRDKLLTDLSTLVNVSTVAQDDGALNVFIGSGQGLVIGGQATQLATDSGTFDQRSVDIFFRSNNSNIPITGALSGGELGGLLDFRREVLTETGNELGRIAMAMTQVVNDQHAQGMDMNGELGGKFFDILGPVVQSARTNTGTGDVTATVADIGALTGDDYLLGFDGSAYNLVRAATNEPVAMSGSGTSADPFVADGVSMIVPAGAAAGDRFLVQPTRAAAGTISVAITDPQRFAAASPVRALAADANLGSGSIVAGSIVDPADPNLLSGATINFTSPTSFNVDGSGPFAYSPGEPITINGAEYIIEGSPETGDTFSVEANAGGVGDNRNAIALSQIQLEGVLEGGNLSVADSFGRLAARIGTVTGQAAVSLEAQGAIRDQAQQSQLAVAGVNLDEEAANMLRFQQSYEAAAQMIGVADSLFQTLIAAVRR